MTILEQLAQALATIGKTMEDWDSASCEEQDRMVDKIERLAARKSKEARHGKRASI